MSTNPDQDLHIAYKKTLRGILLTFLICNITIVAAVVAGFFYTIQKIDETSRNLNRKIDRVYDNSARIGQQIVDKSETLGAEAEVQVKESLTEMKDHGKEAIKDLIRKKISDTKE